MHHCIHILWAPRTDPSVCTFAPDGLRPAGVAGGVHLVLRST